MKSRPGTLYAVLRRLDDLDRDEVLAVHREVSRRAQAIYATLYRDHYEAGMKASAGRAAR